MKLKSLLFLIVILLIPTISSALQRVSFSTDTVSEIDGKVIKMLGGSTWLTDNEIIAQPLDEATIICDVNAPEFNKNDIQKYIKKLPKKGTLIYQNNVVNVTLLDGIFLLSNGYLGKVINSHGNGAVLETEEGYMWAIPEYDQYDTGYWLPPYPVLITGNEMYLINLNKGKKVWIDKRIK